MKQLTGIVPQRFSRTIVSVLLTAVFTGSFLVSSLVAFDPDDPVVREMADKGVNFLRSYKRNPKGGDHLGHIGGRVLRALVIYKYMDVYSIPGAKNDPLVVAALSEAKEWGNNKQLMAEENSCYDLAVVMIFLLEVDASQYRVQAQNMLDELMRRQMKSGAWSYHGQEGLHGDTSQTQYVVLGLWTAEKKGLIVESERVADACNWLLRTQDIGGSWGYHGEDPGPGNFNRVDQMNKPGTVKSNYKDAQSDAACGLSSLYITAGMLQFRENKPPKKAAPKENIAGGAITRKEDPEENQGLKPLTRSVSGEILSQGLGDGDGWFQANNSIKSEATEWVTQASPRNKVVRWPYYFIYVYERYNTFKDLAAGQDEKSPNWYNRGVVFLRENQKADGSWDMGKGGPAANTSFSVFFLIRSTRKSVQNFAQDTTFRGGKELPSNVANARYEDGKVLGNQVSGDIDAILAMLDDPDGIDFSAAELPPELQLDPDAKKRKAQVEKLKALVSQGSYKARRIAVRNLARAEGLDAVPLLLFALTDKDEMVMREARDALRFLSRRLDGFGLRNEPTAEGKAQAYDKWLQWFRTVRPDLDLEEVIISPGS